MIDVLGALGRSAIFRARLASIRAASVVGMFSLSSVSPRTREAASRAFEGTLADSRDVGRFIVAIPTWDDGRSAAREAAAAAAAA